MVIIELYKPRATHMKYIWGGGGGGGGMRSFLNRKRLSYFFKKKIFHTYFPNLNVQTCNCILGGDILYACAKFQSEIISLKTF